MLLMRGLLVLLFVLTTTNARATSVLEVDLKQLLSRSALIFEGRVGAYRVMIDSVSGLPFTRVTFEILDVLKGDYSETNLELDFLGGEGNGKRLGIAEMVYPEIEEVGIYFVEDPNQRLVNPLYGWSQGHFVSYLDAHGERRVRSVGGQPVTSLDFTERAQGNRIGQGVAKGVLTRQNALSTQAIGVEEFKERLREQLELIE